MYSVLRRQNREIHFYSCVGIQDKGHKVDLRMQRVRSGTPLHDEHTQATGCRPRAVLLLKVFNVGAAQTASFKSGRFVLCSKRMLHF